MVRSSSKAAAMASVPEEDDVKMETISEHSSPSSLSTSPPPEPSSQTQTATRRTAADAGLKSTGPRPAKTVKRRASKACQCCRARKVRCNVVEHGAPCTNCRLDEVECIVSESKRKKKWTTAETNASSNNSTDDKANASLPMSAQPPYDKLKRPEEHHPHSLYKGLDKDAIVAQPSHALHNQQILHQLGIRNGSLQDSVLHSIPHVLSPAIPPPQLPRYIKPLPARLGQDDVVYLQKKGALAIPDATLRNELLRNYVEFVHPFMPLLDLNQMLETIDSNDGKQTISLLLFQAIMFAGIATVEISFLKAAGYGNRREARRDFFQKTRLLYDFDIEMDRVSLIQALLLMTYWYETPDDQKDSHHWMGIVVSLSHTIGLHRNQEKTSMEPKRQKLWRRIWWCTYMRDRLIALGMRRPCKIKSGDFDVPMLSLDDFEISALPSSITCLPPDSAVVRDVEKQRQLAIMCVEKAKLCICISNVLSVQYSVLHSNHGVVTAEGTTKTTMMLVAKKLEPREEEVNECACELQEWKDNLPDEAQYFTPDWQDIDGGNESMILNCSLLHMVFYATLSALHRPQVLPSGATPPRNMQTEFMEVSRKAVRAAASEITTIATTLFNFDLVRLLPTPGITVLLPAIIIHLLDIKSPDETVRRTSLQGFCQCMQILGKLRDIYAAADYSTAFLEAAIRKAEIVLPQQRSNEVKEPRSVITSAQGLIDASRRMNIAVLGATSGATPRQDSDRGHLTPPPEDSLMRDAYLNGRALNEDDISRKVSKYLASTPPHSDHHMSDHSAADSMDLVNDAEMAKGGMFLDGAIAIPGNDFTPAAEPDFDGFLDLDAAGEIFSLDDDAFAAMQGESSGFTMDVDWIHINPSIAIE